MTEPREPKSDSRVSERLKIVESAFSPNGVLYELAKVAVPPATELRPDDVADVLLPPRQPGEKYHARWELLENSTDIIKVTAEAESEAIYTLAEQLDLRRRESVSELTTLIDLEKAVWMVEGGANRTSVVRRQLAIDAVRALYGEHVGEQVIYQFGSDRLIPEERGGQPNPEHTIAREIAGGHLEGEYEFTEFQVAVASALSAGYKKTQDYIKWDRDAIHYLLILEKEGSPTLCMIQPKNKGRGLIDGVNIVHDLIMDENSGLFLAEPYIQPIIATNGQYRAKDELQVSNWARERDLNILPPVALGDEPGYKVAHNGKEIVTAERAPMTYVNEIVILHRLAQ